MSDKRKTEPTYAGDVLSPEDRARLGLVVDPPAPQTHEQVAAAIGADPDELRIMGTVRNADDLARANREIAALRQARAEAEAQRARDAVRDRL